MSSATIQIGTVTWTVDSTIPVWQDMPAGWDRAVWNCTLSSGRRSGGVTLNRHSDGSITMSAGWGALQSVKKKQDIADALLPVLELEVK